MTESPKTKCIFCGCELDQDKTTEEHVLQNFLGTKWVSSKISCNACQSRFGEGIDADFSRFFDDIRCLINAGTGRIKNNVPPITEAKDRSGRVYHILPRGRPKLAKPYIETDGKEIKVLLTSRNEKEWGIHEFKKQYPNIYSENFSPIQSKVIRDCGPLSYTKNIQITSFAKGLLKSGFNLLGVNNNVCAISAAFDSFREYMEANDSEAYDNTSRFFQPVGALIHLPMDNFARFAHQLYVYARDHTVDGFAKLYGNYTYAMRFSDTYDGPDFLYGYIVDPLREVTPEVRVSDSKQYLDTMPVFEKQEKDYNETFCKALREQQPRFKAAYYLDAIMRDVLKDSPFIEERHALEIADRYMKCMYQIPYTHSQCSDQI